MTTNQEAIRKLFAVMNSYVGNLPMMPAIFPDNLAPVVRNVNGDRELMMMRWACRNRAGVWPDNERAQHRIALLA